MNIEQALPTFIAEATELLDDMESQLLALEQATSADALNAIFRAIHTIKGSAGLFGLDAVVAFTHVVEGVLDRAREGRVTFDSGSIATLLQCVDHTRELIAAASGSSFDDDLQEQGRSLLRSLTSQAGSEYPAVVADAPLRRIPSSPSPEHWHISLRFARDVLRHGLDPLPFIRYLGTLGRIEAVATLHEAMPAADEMNPQSCYLGFEIAFSSPTADKATIESAFEFVLDDCQLRIIPPHSRINDYLDLIAQLPERPALLGELLVQVGSVTRHELDTALEHQAANAALPQPLGEILLKDGATQVPVVEAALARQRQIRDGKALEQHTVRVDAHKLDQLIDQVGELIIAAASANLVARRGGNAEQRESNATLMTLIEGLRDNALGLRMVKIGATFSRFHRVVHDAARELGKDIALEINGEDTELDKTVVEKIADPLTHLVRNAVDHGIEPHNMRLQFGKPARGTVMLSAYHDSGSIVIEVSDDGAGLDRERILAKGIERGLVEPGRTLSDDDVFALIFEPGFSTAQQVTNLSGRGVGMDVVKRNIEALRGSVHIASRPRQGTTVSVRLPLTLAIINGFQVSVGGSIFVMPLEMVDECIEYSAEAEHDYTNLRGEVLPFIRLRTLFAIDGATPAKQNIVVVRHASARFGIVVDRLLGEAQTVIKPLARMFSQVQGVSGSSILGSGEVALILDVPKLMAAAAATRRVASAMV
ncbi:MAG TPA: chemotaxis protein CheA [Burkholderiaceae bacterium]|nr:chemotaxis protein CheA [Burkholderiaceae bacterium]